MIPATDGCAVFTQNSLGLFIQGIILFEHYNCSFIVVSEELMNSGWNQKGPEMFQAAVI